MAPQEDRLDRVELILAEVAERQAEGKRDQALLRSELREFIAIVREYVEVTNRRLNALEDRQ